MASAGRYQWVVVCVAVAMAGCSSPVRRPEVTGVSCAARLPPSASIRSANPGAATSLAPPGATAVLACAFNHGGDFSGSWMDLTTVALLNDALDRRPDPTEPATSALLICGAFDPGHNDIAYEFVFGYTKQPIVAVEVFLWQTCRPAQGAGWVFHADNGTLSGTFALGGPAADTLRGYVNGPEA